MYSANSGKKKKVWLPMTYFFRSANPKAKAKSTKVKAQMTVAQSK